MRQLARQLGRYHVLDRIAFGGMAEIFRALTFEEDGRGRIVAIKQVLPHYAEDHEFIEMLVDEAKLVSMLHHRNIVEIYEVSFVDNVYFLAMEHVAGKDLRAVLERCRARGAKVPFELAAYLLAEALAGLDTAHRMLDPAGKPAGLVHRDFSPSNVLIAYDGSVKICDFGIAKANFSRIQTKTGVIKGKVKYMSPEQAFGRKLDHRSDIFSAGSVLYEMLTGEPPFLAKNEIDLIFMVRDAHIIAPSRRVPAVPPELEQAVLDGMARARGSRFQSAAEFRQALLGYLRKRGAGAWGVELSRFIQALYAEDIEKERQVLASFDLEVDGAAADLGRNLIADVLGEDAPYTKFNPQPTRARSAPTESAVHEASTRLLDLDGVEDLATVIREAPPAEGVDQMETAAIELPGPSEEDQTSLWASSADRRAEPPAPPRVVVPSAPAPRVPPRTPPPGAHGMLDSATTEESTLARDGGRTLDEASPLASASEDAPTTLSVDPAVARAGGDGAAQGPPPEVTAELATRVAPPPGPGYQPRPLTAPTQAAPPPPRGGIARAPTDEEPTCVAPASRADPDRIDEQETRVGPGARAPRDGEHDGSIDEAATRVAKTPTDEDEPTDDGQTLIADKRSGRGSRG